MQSTTATALSHGASAFALLIGGIMITHAAATLRPPAANTLPDLSGSEAQAPARFILNRETMEFAYADRELRWGARLDEPYGTARAMTLDYGTLLTDRLGAGAAVRRGIDYSDLWINGVFAPQRNLRVRVAGGQLKANSGFADVPGATDTVQQHSYLLGARQSWKNGPLSALGMTTYSVEAGDPGAARASMDGGFGMESSDLVAAGRQQGHVLNLQLRPGDDSRIDIWRERTRLSYRTTDGVNGERDLVASRVRFSQRFDNCVRFEGGYGSNQETSRLDFSLARDRWQFNVSRADGISGNHFALGVGYRLPLGSAVADSGTCSARPEHKPAFESLIDATVRRPAQFPEAPIAVGDAG